MSVCLSLCLSYQIEAASGVTVISEHICFLLFSFSVCTLFSCLFRAVD